MLRYLFPCLFLAAIVVAGCGGGSVAPPNPGPSASSTPNSGPTNIPVNPSATPQVVFLEGGGYTLQFTVPPVTNGSSATMSAVLQTTLPAGVNAPQAHSRATNIVPVKRIATTFTGSAYLIVSTTESVGFSSAPSFVFTLPAGTTITAGQYAYLLFWDPYVGPINGWINLLGPGTVSGQTVTFPGVPTGVQLNANAQYIYALAISSQAVPTATPAPTPTPTVAPSASPSSVPAYCQGISAAQTPGQKVTFTDSSGTGGVPVLYVATATQYLNAQGQMTNWSNLATAQPFPLTCFPGSTGGSGATFELPVASAGRMFIALATPPPSGATTPPNPLILMGNNGGGYAPPDNGGGDYPDGKTPLYTSTPWDFIEFTLPSGVTDVTQVDQVGLPLELSQSGSTSVGFGSGSSYGQLATNLSKDTNYGKLVVNSTFNGRGIVLRVISPAKGAAWGFPQDWFYNSTYNTSYAPNPPNRGYIGYVLQTYKTTPQLYSLYGTNSTATPTTNDYYCAQSDGSASFTFVEIGTSTTCTPSTTAMVGGNSYTLQAYNTVEAFNTGGSTCLSAVLSMPAGGPGGPLADNNAFYLWKALVIELARGTALQSVSYGHPISTWQTGAPFTTPTPPPFTSYYLDPVFDLYAQQVHEAMLGNNSYALQYDEPGGLAPTLTGPSSVSGPALQITVQNIPPAVSAPTPVPSPVATPLVCPTS